MVAAAILREFAEMPGRFTEIPTGSLLLRSVDARRCILKDEIWATIGGIRVAPEQIDDLLAEVRAVVPAGLETTWEVGPSSEPATLEEDLRRRGLVSLVGRPSELRALVLTSEPEAPNGVDVRPCRSFEEYVEARHTSWDAFGVSEERRAREGTVLRTWYDEMAASDIPAMFLAFADGRLAGSAVAIPSPHGVFLGGGSVAGWARRRGIYRALVRARWDYAVARGTPACATHSNPATSYPILMDLGFEEVGTITRLTEAARP